MNEILHGTIKQIKIDRKIYHQDRTVRRRTKEVNIPIKPGMLTSERIRLVSSKRLRTCIDNDDDIISFIIQDEPNSLFTRVDHVNVEYVIELNWDDPIAVDLIKGEKAVELKIPTLDGDGGVSGCGDFDQLMTINIQPEKKEEDDQLIIITHRIIGKGLPYRDSDDPQRRGDLLVKIIVEKLPKSLSGEVEEKENGKVCFKYKKKNLFVIITFLFNRKDYRIIIIS